MKVAGPQKVLPTYLEKGAQRHFDTKYKGPQGQMDTTLGVFVYYLLGCYELLLEREQDGFNAVLITPNCDSVNMGPLLNNERYAATLDCWLAKELR